MRALLALTLALLFAAGSANSAEYTGKFSTGEPLKVRFLREVDSSSEGTVAAIVYCYAAEPCGVYLVDAGSTLDDMAATFRNKNKISLKKATEGGFDYLLLYRHADGKTFTARLSRPK